MSGSCNCRSTNSVSSNTVAGFEGPVWGGRSLERRAERGRKDEERKWREGTEEMKKNIPKTRNTFCGTWYLPHSQFHSERTVPIIMAGCIALRVHETAIFSLPVQNLTSPSCFSTPIS